MSGELVPRNAGPGLIEPGWAEKVLERAATVDDPADLWDGATTLGALAQKWNGHGREKTEIKSAQMLVEIELGQRLGANPGVPGPKPGESSCPHADIPRQRIEELRRFHGHRDFLIEEVRNGKRSRRSLLLAIDRKECTTVGAEDLDIRRGDFREALADIEPGSTALILTDPPYPAEYLPLWSDLGSFAARTLVDGGSLVAYCGQSILPEVLTRLDEHLRYWWTLALVHGQSQMIPGKFVSAGWKPVVWFVREQRRNQAMLTDHIKGGTPRKTLPTGDSDAWAQAVEPLEPVISALTAPGELVIDPFAGSGTVGIAAKQFGRKFIGAEIG